MCDIPVPQAKYSLLLDNKRKYNVNKGIIFIVLGCVSFFLALCGLYVAVCNSDHVHFPRFPSQVPSHNIQRALKYNNVANITYEEKTYASKTTESVPPKNYKLVCYYNFPSKNYPSGHTLRELTAEKIDPKLCTHINMAFGRIVNNSVYIDEFQQNVSSTVMGLKKYNKNLKVLLSVGGSGSGGGFPEMVLNHENRKTFIKSVLNLVKEHKFDGIDLDWEFPNEHIRNDSKQKMHFTQLLHEIRNEINRQQKHRFLLTVAVAAPQFLVDISYDVMYMNENVDFVNVMTYDYHFYTTTTPFTGINAPLYATPNEIGYFSTLNINYSSTYWNLNGMDKQKIVIGLPTYGHTFSLMNVNNNGIKAPAVGYGKLGSGGFVDYRSICWFLQKNKITPNFDDSSKSPFATKATEWISFDDVQSISYKAEYIKKNNFGGAMIYALNTDDYDGQCKQNVKSVNQEKVTFPLTRKVRDVLQDEEL